MSQKYVLILTLLFTFISTTCSATALHDAQDKIGTDKLCHFAWGYVINDQLKRHTKMSALERALCVAGIAVAKERFVDNHFDGGDAFATCLGGISYEIKF